jgi:hypothetical protein
MEGGRLWGNEGSFATRWRWGRSDGTKMKALFVPVTATNERVKAIWSAVINLKERIDEELAAFED